VNVQVIADAAGRLAWASPALPGSAYDLTAGAFNQTSRGRPTVVRVSYGLLRGTAVPTLEQCQEFVAHVCWAHSWYKHLSLLRGAEFVVLLDAEAGAGFTEDKPRYHYSWRTTEEYRRRFGFLNFQWRDSPDASWYREGGGSPARLPEELLRRCSFTLFPYVSSDFNALEAISYGFHQDDLAVVRQLPDRPDRERLLAWDMACRALEETEPLDGEESRLLGELLDQPEPRLGGAPDRVVAEYLARQRRSEAYQALQEPEERKIERAVEELCDWPAATLAEGADGLS
jgi:hypothetical protein